MKTARFATVVQKCGKPEMYLALAKPAQDRTLQAAIKGNRVMTVEQENVGTKTDRGEVGFHSGKGRQYLMFPKSLRAFEGKTIVGIKYDLLAPHEVAESDRVVRRAAKKTTKTTKKKSNKVRKIAEVAREMRRPREEEEEEEETTRSAKKEEESSEVKEIKRQIRRAMKDLEAGKAVAAFKVLKGVLDE